MKILKELKSDFNQWLMENDLFIGFKQKDEKYKLLKAIDWFNLLGYTYKRKSILESNWNARKYIEFRIYYNGKHIQTIELATLQSESYELRMVTERLVNMHVKQL